MAAPKDPKILLGPWFAQTNMAAPKDPKILIGPFWGFHFCLGGVIRYPWPVGVVLQADILKIDFGVHVVSRVSWGLHTMEDIC